MIREPIVGFVTEVGTRTSHTAIMARALEIPAVVGVAGALASVRTGDTIIVDGLRGEVHVRPSTDMAARARARGDRHFSRTQLLRKRLREPTTFADGTRVALKANVELPTEALLAVEHGAEGIGLYRTEFLYIDRKEVPSEDEQFELYRTIAQMMSPRTVTLRTFDLGGDKRAPNILVPEEANPALGLRAIRLALREPALFMAQLRAMVRASAFGELRVMVPMVSSVAEFRECRSLLDRAVAEVEAAGHEHGQLPLGMMIEVPAAAVCADLFAREAAFFSLGTNDLVQYVLAIDRASLRETWRGAGGPPIPSYSNCGYVGLCNLIGAGRLASLETPILRPERPPTPDRCHHVVVSAPRFTHEPLGRAGETACAPSASSIEMAASSSS
jgi:phosphotransferase system enzyme I (PtsI)